MAIHARPSRTVVEQLSDAELRSVVTFMAEHGISDLWKGIQSWKRAKGLPPQSPG